MPAAVSLPSAALLPSVARLARCDAPLPPGPPTRWPEPSFARLRSKRGGVARLEAGWLQPYVGMFVLHNLLAHQQKNAPAECIVEAKAALLALLAVRHPGAGFLTLKELVGGQHHSTASRHLPMWMSRCLLWCCPNDGDELTSSRCFSRNVPTFSTP